MSQTNPQKEEPSTPVPSSIPTTPAVSEKVKDAPKANEALDREKEECTSTKEEEEELVSQKAETLKALNEGHNTLKGNLQRAWKTLSGKTQELQDLEEQISRQKEENWLLEEKIRLLTEKECILVRNVDEKEKRLESVHKELEEAKWKLQEAQEFLQKLEIDQIELKRRQSLHQEKILELEASDSEMIEDDNGNEEPKTAKELFEDIQQLRSLKSRLDERDPELLAIQNGDVMLESENRKRELQEALRERTLRVEAMYLEVDELSERIDEKAKSIESKKKGHDLKIRQLKSQLQCLTDTERRLQRTVDYMKAKIDYGMNVPAPEPWFDSKKSY